ncbi:MAG: hypothetical protein LAT67_09095 [Balneolales bacterium]|nr:hypothetical protein [Balneolales bacterium]
MKLPLFAEIARNYQKLFWFALGLGILLSFIPLVQEVHFLSANISGLIFSALSLRLALKNTRSGQKPAAGLRECLFLALIAFIPIFPLLAGSLIRSCFSGSGLAFWILIPVPSVVFTYALGRYFTLAFPALYSRYVAWGIYFFIAAGIFLAELYSLPHVRFHNHIWGYWPGPIYDSEVALSPSLVAFRYLSLCWAALFWLAPYMKTSYGKKFRLPFILLAASLLLGYMNLNRTGIISTESHIRNTLGGVHFTEYAVLFFDRSVPDDKILFWGKLHDFHIQEIAAQLGLDLLQLPRVRSYVYRHEWQKKRLTGAGGTVYVPVWNRNPQMHIHQQALLPVLRHELVHVLAREIGMPLFNASPNIALTEGLAVALQTERNSTASLHQIVALQDELPDTDTMRSLMSLTGFYKLSGQLSYTLAGSFTAWLLDSFPPEYMHQAYRTGNIETAFKTDFKDLVTNWHTFLQTIPTDPGQRFVSDRIFTAPGLLDISCVLHPKRHHFVLNEAQILVAEQRYEEAALLLDVFGTRPGRLSIPMLRLFVTAGLRAGKPDLIASKIERAGIPPEDLPADLLIQLSDLYAILDQPERQQFFIAEVAERHPDWWQLKTRIKANSTDLHTILKLEYSTGNMSVHSIIDSSPYWNNTTLPFGIRHCIRTGMYCNSLAGLYTDIADESVFIPLYLRYAQLLSPSKPDYALQWLHKIDSLTNSSPMHLARRNQLEEIRRFTVFLTSRKSKL